MSQKQVLDRLEFGSNQLRVEGGEVTIHSEMHDNLAQTPQSSREIPQVGMVHASAKGTLRMAGSGTAGTGPPIDALFAAAAMKGAISAGVSVTYERHASPLEATPMDVDLYLGNTLLHACNSAVCGLLEWVLEPGKPVAENFNLDGLYEAPTDAVGSAALGTAARAPVCKALTVTVGGQAFNFKGMRIAIVGETTAPDGDLTAAHAVDAPELVDFHVEVDATVLSELVATFDMMDKFTSETKLAVNAVVGSVAGNIITFDVDTYFREVPVWSVDNKRYVTEMKLIESKASADQQLKITYT